MSDYQKCTSIESGAETTQKNVVRKPAKPQTNISYRTKQRVYLALTPPLHPHRSRDYYHTCYVLSGLSSAQHTLAMEPGRAVEQTAAFVVGPTSNLLVCDRQLRFLFRASYA
jgi:hypothetical protein